MTPEHVVVSLAREAGAAIFIAAASVGVFAHAARAECSAGVSIATRRETVARAALNCAAKARLIHAAVARLIHAAEVVSLAASAHAGVSAILAWPATCGPAGARARR